MEEEFSGFTINMSIDEIYLLYDCVKRRIETWEGTPIRPAEEQQHLMDLRDNLYRCILDYKFTEM